MTTDWKQLHRELAAQFASINSQRDYGQAHQDKEGYDAGCQDW